jgi:leucyl-tRNA synthetase
MNEKTLYQPEVIEPKWQAFWEKKGLHKVSDQVSQKENFYQLVEFAYPSGNLHVGHWYAFAVPDIHARFQKMQGKNVLYPIGFDAFGLPAENAAIKRNLNPRDWTYDNMQHMETQLRSMGAIFDWERKVVTCDPSYYRWTQWLFIQLFKAGLVEERETLANWCPSCKTVLANEQVVNNTCERCGTAIEKKVMKQWQVKITTYADRLIDDLDVLDWPEEIKLAQKNWIGRSEGAEIEFPVLGTNDTLTVFTTRPDTLFGVTYMVVAPEHTLLKSWQSQIENWPEVELYKEEAKKKSEIERTNPHKEKTGVELRGIKALNPATKEEIPVYVADYVLAGYGTGAIMAVPGHDERDHAFAEKFGVPIKEVIEECVVTEGARDDAYRPEEPVEARKNVAVCVYDPKTDSFLSISWKNFDMRGVPTGGLEDGESIEVCARREILEETGYKNLKLVALPETQKHTKFYHRGKKVNRHAIWNFALFELIDDEREVISEEDQAQHEVVWIKKEKLRDYFSVAEARWAVDLYLKQGQKQIVTTKGILVHSEEFDGMSSVEAGQKILASVGGRMTKTYRLRDWGVSRQRYWGCPIPLIHCADCGWQAVSDEHLPVELPVVENYLPNDNGESPLSKNADFVNTTCPTCSKPARRETDTLDTFVDSSWYFLRYCDPTNTDFFADKEKLKKWMPVNLYSGGAEHTTMHLLYSRFFHKALFDLGLVAETEPYQKRMNRSLILGPDGNKMSKSKGNVIDPDEIVAELGADTIRMYLAFIGPYNEVGAYPWNPESIVGVRRFLDRVWKLESKVATDLAEEKVKEADRVLHQTLAKVEESIRTLKMNTGVAALMSAVNVLEKSGLDKEQWQLFLLLLAPYAPHIAEELWSRSGEEKSLFETAWPVYDESKVIVSEVTYMVQINGKIRDQFQIAPDAPIDEVETVALGREKVLEYTAGKEVKKVIVVPNKLVSIVIS